MKEGDVDDHFLSCSVDKKILVCDLDNVLLGDFASMSKLLATLDNIPSNFMDKVELWICTGRSIESSIQVLLLWGVHIFPKVSTCLSHAKCFHLVW